MKLLSDKIFALRDTAEAVLAEAAQADQTVAQELQEAMDSIQEWAAKTAKLVESASVKLSMADGCRSLSQESATQVKRLLWEGYSQVEVAQMVGAAQGTISMISMGRRAWSAPWPDGSVGAMPRHRAQEVLKIRRHAQGNKLERFARRSFVASQAEPLPDPVIAEAAERVADLQGDIARQRDDELLATWTAKDPEAAMAAWNAKWFPEEQKGKPSDNTV